RCHYTSTTHHPPTSPTRRSSDLSASDNPSSRIRRQFQSTTSRGAYSVCATAIAVHTAPNAPHTPPISPRLCAPATLTIIAGEKQDRKSTRLNSSHEWISYAVFCL